MKTPRVAKNPIEEAKRYVANAKQLLSDKAGKEEVRYQDRKYVRMASHAAYMGVLIALDALIAEKIKGRKAVKWYQEHLAAIDKKLLGRFNDAYDTLHLALAYDGNLDATVVSAGMKQAEDIINWVETRTAQA